MFAAKSIYFYLSLIFVAVPQVLSSTGEQDGGEWESFYHWRSQRGCCVHRPRNEGGARRDKKETAIVEQEN